MYVCIYLYLSVYLSVCLSVCVGRQVDRYTFTLGVGKYPSFFHAPLFLWPNYEIKTNPLKILISVNLLCRIMAKIQNGRQN